MISVSQLLGQRVRYFRNQLNLTQEQFAYRVGVSNPGYISEIERGKKQPSYGLAFRIARELGIELKDLFDFESENQSSSQMSQYDRWLPKYERLLRNKSEEQLKLAYEVLQKLFRYL